MSGRDVFIAGSIGPLGDLAGVPPERGPSSSPSRPRCSTDAASTSSWSRRSTTSTSSSTAIEAVRERLAPADRRDADLRRGRRDARAASPRAEAAERLRPLGPGRDRREPRRRPARRAGRARGDGRRRRPPLAALPNVGLASLSGGRVIYPHATPEYFAEFAAHARRLGARLIGGCCGTTPLEIAAIASAVEEERKPSAPLDVIERELVRAALDGGAEETELARKLRAGEWVTCVELDPPKGGTYDSMLDVARTLKALRARSASSTSTTTRWRARGRTRSWPRSRSSATAGIETIPHVTPRDTSIMGLESQLLGAHAEGRPQRARRHRRPARGRRLPGLAAASTRSTRSASRR